MTARDTYPVTDCDNCGEATSYESLEAHKLRAAGESFDDITITEGSYVPVHNGLCLDLTGHYGGFTDSAFDSERSHRNVVLCHDCSLKVARALPGIFPKGSGLHSMFSDEEHTSCCEFAWSLEKDTDVTLVGDGKGGWVPREEN